MAPQQNLLQTLVPEDEVQVSSYFAEHALRAAAKRHRGTTTLRPNSGPSPTPPPSPSASPAASSSHRPPPPTQVDDIVTNTSPARSPADEIEVRRTEATDRVSSPASEPLRSGADVRKARLGYRDDSRITKS